MVLDNEMVSVKQYFSSNHIKLSDCWLENCVQWFRQQNSTYTQKELHLKIYEQWLLLDFRDVDVTVLPPNLNTALIQIINGTYSLQLMYVVDISRPKLWQLQRLRNPNSLAQSEKDPEHTNSSKRVLQLLLTDGVQEIKAMEFGMVSCLHQNLTPGMKVQVIGPVTVRRGQIMLEGNCIKLLGGEVEELLISNAFENVLARSLKLPENANPKIMEATFNSANMDIINTKKTSNKPKPCGRNIDKDSDNLHTQKNKVFINNSSNVVSKTLIIDEEEELRIANEIEVLMEVENDISFGTKKSCKSPDMFEDVDFDAVIKKIDSCESSTTTKSTQLGSTNKKSTPIINNKIQGAVSKKVQLETNAMDSSLDISTFGDIVDADFLKEMHLHEHFETDQFLTLLELKNKVLSGTEFGKLKAKAKYKRIAEKLTVCDEAWYLKIVVEDASGELEVMLHNDVITLLIGYSSNDMMSLKSNVINKDPNTIATVMKAIDNFKNKIVKLECTMEFEYLKHNAVPVIVKLL